MLLICTSCKQQKEDFLFNKRKAAIKRNGMREICRECEHKKYYESEECLKYQRQRKEIKIDWVFGLSIKRIAGMDMKPKVQKFTHYKGWKFNTPLVVQDPKPTFWQKIKQKVDKFLEFLYS